MTAPLGERLGEIRELERVMDEIRDCVRVERDGTSVMVPVADLRIVYRALRARSVTPEQIEAAADAIRRRDEFEDTTQEHHRILAREALSAALGLDVEAGEGHEFLPVRGHPDDDECTHRADGTDATYCGLPKAAHVEGEGR